MPRRLIIGILVVLIIGILGGTGVLLWQRFFGSPDTTSDGTTGTGQLEPAGEGPQTVTNPTGDDDSDGLTNAEEALWGTLPNNPDSDGDGTNDGTEVQINRNPTIAGPNDQLPPGFQPDRDLQPLQEAPLQIDQIFADDVNLAGPPNNLTDRYNQQVPPEQQTNATLVQFVEQQAVATRLPSVQQDAITISQDDSPAAMRAYLENASNFGSITNPDVIRIAINDLLENGDSSTANGLSIFATEYQRRLLELSVPPSARNAHQLLLGYAEALRVTYGLMSVYNQDPVKGLFAIHQLEVLSDQFSPTIDSEIERLETIAGS